MGGVIYQKRFFSCRERASTVPQEPPTCHPERAKRAEGSSHLPPAQALPGAKILRLRASPFAQDDRLSHSSSFWWRSGNGHPGRGVPTGIFFVAVETWCRAHRRAVGLPPPLGLIVLRTLYHPTFYTGITA